LPVGASAEFDFLEDLEVWTYFMRRSALRRRATAKMRTAALRAAARDLIASAAPASRDISSGTLAKWVMLHSTPKVKGPEFSKKTRLIIEHLSNMSRQSRR
jgi:hypothetical protein